MCSANLFLKIYTGDKVGNSLNTEAAVQKYCTEERLRKFRKILKNISVVEYQISISMWPSFRNFI